MKVVGIGGDDRSLCDVPRGMYECVFQGETCVVLWWGDDAQKFYTIKANGVLGWYVTASYSRRFSVVREIQEIHFK